MAIDPCTEYGLALAIEDFVPVLLAGAGTVVLGLAAGRVAAAVRDPGAAGRRAGHPRRLLQGALEDAGRGRAVP